MLLTKFESVEIAPNGAAVLSLVVSPARALRLADTAFNLMGGMICISGSLKDIGVKKWRLRCHLRLLNLREACTVSLRLSDCQMGFGGVLL